MSWTEFLRVVPIVIEFVQGLNLPPRSTVVAASGLIFGLAYSYKYFRPNQCPKKLDMADVLSENPENLLPTDGSISDASDNNSTDSFQMSNNCQSTSEITAKVIQNITSAEQVFGSIENTGEQQTINIGSVTR